MTTRPLSRFGLAGLFALALATPAPAQPTTRPEPSPPDSCIDCHSDPDLMVTDKKLYDYFQSWRASLHGLAAVTCVDCHGGDPAAPGRVAAHGTGVQGAVSFQNVPSTCGQCHGEVLAAYLESPHYAHLQRTRAVGQGPNCVTCHGSLNAKRLDVTTVREVCQRCHNPVTGLRPETPLAAEALLNDLNAIRGYRRYVSLRGSTEVAAEATSVLDDQLEGLATSWHRFDLDAIRSTTRTLLSYGQDQRDRVREERSRPPPDD